MTQDFPTFLRRLTIINKHGVTTPFVLNQEQILVEKLRTGRDVIFKKRQTGITSLELARDLWFAAAKGKNAVVVGISDSSQSHFHNLNMRVSHMMKSLQDESFVDKGDGRYESTAVGGGSLRVIQVDDKIHKKGLGHTIHRLHFAEAAHNEDDETIDALLACVPPARLDTEIVFETSFPGSSCNKRLAQIVVAAEFGGRAFTEFTVHRVPTEGPFHTGHPGYP